MKSFTKFLSNFDLFSFPIALSLSGTEKTSTITGKLVTIFIITFLLYSLIRSDMVLKKNPTVLSQDLKMKSRPLLTFSKSNFTLVASISDVNNVFFSDSQIFSVILYQYYVNNGDGTNIVESYTMELCKPEDFTERPDDYYRLNLSKAYCAPNNVSLKMSGYWDEEIIQYFTVDIYLCTNSTSNNTCKSEEEIQDFIYLKYLNIYFTNNNFDFSNYHDIIQSQFKMYYQILDVKLRKEINFFIKSTRISTDDGALLENENIIMSYQYDTFQTDVFAGETDDPAIYSVLFYPSDVQSATTRKYQSFSDLLAQLGGILNFLISFGFFVAKIENHYNLTKLFSNELYIFQKTKDNEQENAMKITNIFSNDTERHPNFEQNKANILCKDNENAENAPLEKVKKIDYIGAKTVLDDIPLPESLKNIEEKEKNEKVNMVFEIKNTISPVNATKRKSFSPFKRNSRKKSFGNFDKTEKQIQYTLDNLVEYQKIKNKEKHLNFGFFEYLKVNFLKIKKWNLNLKEKLFIKGEEQINKEIDLLHILKILQEVEKMKRVLLSNEQLILFNLLAKPMIKLPMGSNLFTQDTRFKFSIHENEKINKNDAISAYINAKEQYSEIDRRILELLDEDVKVFIGNK